MMTTNVQRYQAQREVQSLCLNNLFFIATNYYNDPHEQPAPAAPNTNRQVPRPQRHPAGVPRQRQLHA